MKPRPVLLLLLLLLLLGGAVQGGTRYPHTFPVCLTDAECTGPGHRCFQYMCFPWAETEAVTDWTACRRSSDCSAGRECWRHPDRRSVHTGICLDTRWQPDAPHSHLETRNTPNLHPDSMQRQSGPYLYLWIAL